MGILDWARAIAIGRRPKRTLVRLVPVIVLGLITVLFFRFVLTPVRITGPSMIPTFQDGSIKFLNRLAYLRSEPKRGDIVGIRYSGNHVLLVKRVVGLPGELVGFQYGRFYVNGKPLHEPYLNYPCAKWHSEPKTLGPNEYYVVGDNRSMPIDFHYQGAADRRRIIGKILLLHGDS
ncbi:MAG TPA: signal peptidase I [Verrucomicrobiae bacterium]|nr:signal peptidase I [Verrucomicrobiae bacterium]